MFSDRPVGGYAICDAFVTASRRRADEPLFVDPTESMTGSDALRRAMAVAGTLRGLGIEHGSNVAFLCGPTGRHACALFGVLLAGSTVCNLHARETAAHNVEALDWLEAACVFFDDDFAETAQAFAEARPGMRLVALGDEIVAGTEDFEVEAADPAATAAIILSSGTTGAPKGVVHSQRTLMETARAGRYVYGRITAHDRVIVAMWPSFAAWYHVVLPYLAAGAEVVFLPDYSPQRFLETVQARRITMASLVPTMWRDVLGAGPGGYDLSSVGLAFFSGEPGTEMLVQGLRSGICANVGSAYLASESGNAAGLVAGTADLVDDGLPGTAGRPGPDGDVRIVDPDGAIGDVVAHGQTGEIVVTGPSLALGYWCDAALSASKFVDGWWRSGDLGYLDDQGRLFVVGRTDNVINTGGIKVHAEEIESVLLGHPAVVQAAVVGAADPQWGERIEAHLVLADPVAGPDEILDFCRGRLARMKVPKSVHFHDALPTGPTGKLARRELRMRQGNRT